VALRERATKGLVWSLIERWGNEVLALGIFAVLSRQLEPEAFGLVALASVVIDFARRFVDQGFSEAVVQRGELDKEHLDTAFWTGIATGALLGALMLGCADLLAAAFSEPKLAPVLRWLSLGFVIRGLSSTQQALLVRSLRFKQLALRTLVAELASGAVAISLVLTGWGVWSLVGQSLAGGLFGVLTLWSVSSWRPGLGFRWRHFRQLALFGVNIVGFKLLNLLTQRVDMLLVGSFLGTVALGYYSVAGRIFHAITKALTGMMNAVAFPVFSRLQGEPERMRRAFYEATQLTSLVTLPAFLGLVAIAPDAIPWAFGEQWGPSVPVMRVLAGLGILQSLTHFNGSVLKAVGKPSWRLGIALLQTVCTALAILFAVRFGITAVAIASVSVAVALYPVGFYAVRRLIGIEPLSYAAQFAGPLFAALLCMAAALGVRHLGDSLAVPVRIALATAAGAAAYVLGLQLVAPALLRRTFATLVTAVPGRGRGREAAAPPEA
jgi:PST family polysaccharide transporter